ncbi:hypothetical protein GLOTRDRAFT_133883 [Gloeophyllum trabeum ATCC 11539]|uniref:Uncharacterized protein n=1 Tax=Gloeophyllum trabeum (strain ATCC 11539 / FP-39264 / Madison 617) TaxID=670483 RepID=S7PT14_GLOTA|nr:uncharacterized protein GLOTRDRAFT_133883 [Gloeophyllum trabeum ATCC 11539]EPQ50513.1 hypothetical protein GLOTRDRAFT_133883 [Gloeophyllum trabeum ATCC 11539]
MPEAREARAQQMYGKMIMEAFIGRAYNCTLINIWADATDAEQTEAEDNPSHANKSARRGKVFVLDETCTSQRGQNNNQTPLIPNNWTPKLNSKFQLNGSESISSAGKTVIIDFGHDVLSIAPLLHTSLQCYSSQTWYSSVVPVKKKGRAKIGIAFEFANFVLAFCSLDLCFQPQWQSQELAPRDIPPDVYDKWEDFLKFVVAEYQHLLTNMAFGDGSILNHFQGSIWSRAGAGEYSWLEILAYAAIHPNLTVGEVIRSPSRLARLCAAFYMFIHQIAHDDGVELRCLHPKTMTMAPTVEQRLKYKNMLLVQGKRRLLCTNQQAELIDKYYETLQKLRSQEQCWPRETAKLYDCFEPNLIRAVLTRETCNLGALIFGQSEWKQLGGRTQKEVDPLTQMYRRHAPLSLARRTFLPQGYYESLFVEPRPRRFQPVFVYRYTDRNVWTFYRFFPTNSVARSGKPRFSGDYTEYTGDEMRNLLFETIVRRDNTNVALGPLEYCGNAVVVRLGGQSRHKRFVLAFLSEEEEIQTLPTNLRQARQEHQTLVSQLREARSSETSTKFEVDSQQLTLAREELECMSNELSAKTKEFTRYRRAKNAELVQLQAGHDALTQTHASTESMLKALQSAHDAQTHQLTQVQTCIQELTGALAEQDANYATDAGSLKSLAKILEEREQQSKVVVTNIKRDWAEVGEKTVQRVNYLKEIIDKEQERAEAAEKRVEELEEAVQRVSRGELRIPSISAPGTSQTPAAGALCAERLDNMVRRAVSVIEERVPVLNQQREEYERLRLEAVELASQHAETIAERDAEAAQSEDSGQESRSGE